MLPHQWLHQLAQRWSLRGGKRRRRAGRTPARIHRPVRPRLEVLEDRLTPSGYDILSFSGLSQSSPIAPNLPSGAITVQLQDTSGHAITATSDVTVKLSTSSPTGQFLDLSGKSLANNSIVISTGSSSAFFEYEDSQTGQATVKAQAYNPFAFGGVNVNVQNRLVFTTAPQTLQAGQPSQPITLQLQDANGNAVKATNDVTITLSTYSSTGKFLDTSGNPLPTSSTYSPGSGGPVSATLTIAAGSSSASFEYEDTQVGASAFITATASGGANASQSEQIPYTLAFTTPVQMLAANQASGTITVQLQDGKGNAVKAASPMAFFLSSNSFTGKFLDTSGNPLTNNFINIAAGASSASFEYKDSTTGAWTITVNNQAMQQVYVGEPMAIVTPPQTLATGKPSQPITIQLESAATSTVTINLSSTSTTGKFLDTSGKALANNSLTIAAGSSSARFEYEDSTPGLPTITAQKSDLSGSAQQQENVGVSLNFTTAPQTVAQGKQSGTITVQLQDSSGNPVPAPSSLFVQLSSSNGGQFFDTSGNNIFGFISIAAGTNLVSFKYESGSSGPQNVTATINAGGLSLSATQTETVTGSPTPSLVFVSPMQTIVAGQPSQPITVQLQMNGSAVTATSNVTLNLSSSSTTGKFLDTSGNPLANNSITIAAGASTASFEYEDSQEGIPMLSATESGLTIFGSQSENVGGISLVFTSKAQTVTAGQPSGTITVQLEDSNGNPVKASSATFVDLSTSAYSTGKFLDTNGKPLTSPSITIAAGFSSASFEYEDSVGGTPTLTASTYIGSSLTSTQQETVTGSYKIQFGNLLQFLFSGGPQEIAPNTPSKPIAVSLVDSAGQPATPTSPVAVTLSSTSTTGKFLDTSGNALANNTLIIPAGSSTASFEYEDSQIGLPTLTASENGFTTTPGLPEDVGVSVVFTTSPQTLTAGQMSQPVTVQLQDSKGNPFTAASNVSVGLASASSLVGTFPLPFQGVQFFDTSGNPLTNNILTIAAGSNSASFEFSSKWGGAPTLDASLTFGTQATQKETVQGLNTVAITTSAQTLAAGQTSQLVTLKLEDNNGNAANAPSGGLQINLSGTASTKFFDASGNALPTNQFGVATITMPAGSGTVSFEFESTTAGTDTISATIANGPTPVNFTQSGQQETIQAGPPNSVVFLTPAQSSLAGMPSGSITVQLQDKYGNVLPTGSGLTFNLSSSSQTGTFRSASGDPLASSSITIPAGSSSATFEYEDSQSGTPTLTVTASGVSGTQHETITTSSTEIHVTNTNDSGAGSLREAITAANNNPGSTIVFDPGVTGAIDLQSELPYLLSDTNIIGPGATALTIEPSSSTTGSFGGLTIGLPSTVNFPPPQPSVTISGLTVAKFSGGSGITNYGAVTLRQVDVSNNQAPAQTAFTTQSVPYGPAGGISNFGSISVLDSTVADNTTANPAGAGINSESGSVLVINSTIAGNVNNDSSSGGSGDTGGIGIYGGTAFIANSTISGNTASQGKQSTTFTSGGGLDAFGAVTLYDSIVAGNTGTPGNPTDLGSFAIGGQSSSFINSLGYNLIGKALSNLVGFSGTDQVGTAANPIDPQLGALANNGGPTPTMALLSGSPAIAAGSSANAPATDQRGDPRPAQGVIDVGAFEVTTSNNAVSLLPATLPAATVGDSYNQSITASGGSGPLTLSTNPTSLSLPAGLSYSISGSTLTISGKPTATGSVTFTVTAKDAHGDTMTRSYTLTANAASTPITLSPASGALPSGTVGTSYTQRITASGGSGSLTVTTSLLPTSLPAGLSFSINGGTLTITGTPMATGSVTFTVTANDSKGDTTGPQSYTLTVNAVGAITLSPGSGALPSGTVGVSYNQSITASGGSGPLTLSTNPTSLSLPAGLSYSISGSTLTISGKPTASGSVSFSVTATDTSGHTETQSYTLRVNVVLPPPPAPPPAPPVLQVPPLLAFLNSLFGGGTEVVNANGTETVTDSFLGFPLIVSTFDSSGKLVDATFFGIDITSLILLL